MNTIIKETPYGYGLFYNGDVDISKDDIVISEKPFFKAPTKTIYEGYILEDNASIAYHSLQLEDTTDKYKKLKSFKTSSTLPDIFKKNVFETYKKDLIVLTLYLKKLPKYSECDDKRLKSIIFTEICKHATYRLCCTEETLNFKGNLFKIPKEWGYYENISRINHSCDPNLKIKDKPDNELDDTMTLVATKTIKKGDQLTFSYCDESADTCSNYGFTCACDTCTKLSDGKRKSKRKSKRRSKSKRRNKRRSKRKSKRKIFK